MTGNPPSTFVPIRSRLAVCRLAPDHPIPAWADNHEFFVVTRTPTELSIVCPFGLVPEGVRREGPWRGLGLEGVIDFSTVGLIARISAALASRGLSLFVVSTFDTDFVLVKESIFEASIRALVDAGFHVRIDRGSDSEAFGRTETVE